MRWTEIWGGRLEWVPSYAKASAGLRFAPRKWVVEHERRSEWGKERRASAFAKASTFAKATADMMADMTADRQDFMVARGERGWTIAATIAADDCERSVYAFQATPDLRFAPRREGLRERATRTIGRREIGRWLNICAQCLRHRRCRRRGPSTPATCNLQLST